MRTYVWLACALLLACPGCDRNGPRAQNRPKLLMYCGAGIQPPVAELAEAFSQAKNVEFAVDYAGSEVLLSRIKLNRKGDLYMPGDRHYLDQAADEGMIAESRSACYFVPTILVARGNPKGIRELRDLTRPGVKLGLGDAQACAIGRTSREIFEKNGIAWSEVEKNLAFQSLTVNELGIQIQAGSLDAVIVWDAIARYYADHGEMVEIPVDQNVISTVAVGVLTFTGHEALAKEFLAFVTGEAGQAVFRNHQYRVDSPGGSTGVEASDGNK